MKNKVITIWLIASLILFAITFSIALPIYFRPFYYMLVKPLKIVESVNEWTGEAYTKKDIIHAYNEILNYCCFYTKFGSGKLKWSVDGMLHFKDCRALFTLDTVVALISGISLVVIFNLKKKKNIEFVSNPYLISGITAIALPIVLGGLISINFDKAFEIFHKIFFPGKDNWLFDPYTDEIIIAMPDTFFMACAIFIGISLISISVFLIIYGIKLKKAQD